MFFQDKIDIIDKLSHDIDKEVLLKAISLILT